MVAVVVPIFKQIPDIYEQISLKRCSEVLRKYSLIFVAPQSLDTSWYRDVCMDHSEIIFEKFDDVFFQSGISGYNKLMLSSCFYNRFLRFRYILIHQLDAFVFEDTLTGWCDNNYDYIGAPWVHTSWFKTESLAILNRVISSQDVFSRYLTKFRWWLSGPTGFCVGNGGLSLRKVSTCLKATLKYKEVLFKWDANEDLFWSIYIPLHSLTIKVPSLKKASLFSFDFNPQYCFKMTGGRLPFGTHAWYREDYPYENNLKFWTPIIDQLVDLPRP